MKKMRGAYRARYKDATKLSVIELPTPIPDKDEVLIKVKAVTVNRTDCAVLAGKPFIMRFVVGFLKPKLPIPGTDFVGQVIEIGNAVSKYKIGDNVWGFRDAGASSQAEYMVYPENGDMGHMPRNTKYIEAVANIEGAHYAINMINKVTIQPSDNILINGATGAIGSALLQILVSKNHKVTAVCNTKNMERIKSLGAINVIDYLAEDFTQQNVQYDYIFDAVGKRTFAECKPVMNRNGVYISSELGPYGQNLFYAMLAKTKKGKRVVFPFPSDIKKSLSLMKELTEKSLFKGVIDRTYPLSDIAEAYDYVRKGQKTGNVVIHFDEEKEIKKIQV